MLQAFEEQTFSIESRHPRSSASEDPCHQPILTDRSRVVEPESPGITMTTARATRHSWPPGTSM
ncbi:MAG: hypothetical protein ACLQDY_04980 [Streptosporangiaceae bacterium]